MLFLLLQHYVEDRKNRGRAPRKQKVLIESDEEDEEEEGERSGQQHQTYTSLEDAGTDEAAAEDDGVKYEGAAAPFTHTTPVRNALILYISVIWYPTFTCTIIDWASVLSLLPTSISPRLLKFVCPLFIYQ